MSANILKTESASTPRGDLQFAIMGGKSRRRVRRLLDKEPDTGFALAKKFAKKDPLLADYLFVRSTGS